MTTSDVAGTASGTGEYADVNGIHLYYERHGSGRPLVLLHGGLMSSETLGPLVQAFAPAHEVIAADLTAAASLARACRSMANCRRGATWPSERCSAPKSSVSLPRRSLPRAAS